jgi:MSHA biogenesis protein MshK
MDLDMTAARHAATARRRPIKPALGLAPRLAPGLAKAGSKATALALSTALALAAACWPAAAQGLPDPTRPPPEAVRALGGGVAAALPAPQANGGLPQLQSVLTGSRGREVAVIDGQTLRRGDKFHGAVLSKVGKNSVVLRRGAKVEVLTLLPAEQADTRPAMAR